jgi:hypothetical protein
MMQKIFTVFLPFIGQLTFSTKPQQPKTMVFGFTRQAGDVVAVSGRDPRFVRATSRLFKHQSTMILTILGLALAVEVTNEFFTNATWSWFNGPVRKKKKTVNNRGVE